MNFAGFLITRLYIFSLVTFMLHSLAFLLWPRLVQSLMPPSHTQATMLTLPAWTHTQPVCLHCIYQPLLTPSALSLSTFVVSTDHCPPFCIHWQPSPPSSYLPTITHPIQGSSTPVWRHSISDYCRVLMYEGDLTGGKVGGISSQVLTISQLHLDDLVWWSIHHATLTDSHRGRQK